MVDRRAWSDEVSLKDKRNGEEFCRSQEIRNF